MEVDDIPYELDYIGVPANRKKVVDWDKMDYSDKPKEKFFADKFTGDYAHIPGFNKIIAEMVMNAPTLLEGWEIKNNKIGFISMDIKREPDGYERLNTNISEQ